MKILLLRTGVLLSAIAPAIGESLGLPPATSSMQLVVSGYAPKISLLEFNPRIQTFSNLSVSTADSAGKSPSFLGFSPDGRYLFGVNEISDFDGRNQTGSVRSWKIERDAQIRLISTGMTGADPVSLAVSPDGKNLITAEYSGGSWSRFCLNDSGEFESPEPVQVKKYQGSGPIKDRQAHSFLHQVVYNSAGNLVFFVDLGGDSVYVHRVDQSSGRVGEMAHEIKVPPGTGPRHLSVLGKHNEYDVYLICELSNKIFTIRLIDRHNELKSTIRQELSTLPAEYSDKTSFGAGEVMVTRDERFVYGTNRQTDFSKPITDNSIVKFGRDLKTGLLKSPTWFPLAIGGKTPRHFSFSNDFQQSFMVVGCQQSNTLLMFHRSHEDGHLKLLSSAIVDAPTVQLFVP